MKSDENFNWWDQVINYVEAHDRLVPRGEEHKKHALAPILIKHINDKLAQMLAETHGGLFFMPVITKVGANKRQKSYEQQRLEQRIAAGDHDHLPQEYDDVVDLLCQLSSYASTFSVVQRYTTLTGEEIGRVEVRMCEDVRGRFHPYEQRSTLTRYRSFCSQVHLHHRF